MTGPELLAARRITLLAGSTPIPPGEATPERVRQAIEAKNHAARLDGQPDDLNPAMLDPARVAAFVEGLSRLPEALLAKLEGRSVALGAEGLLLMTSSPLAASDIEAGYTLSLPDEDEGVIQPALHAALDPSRAEAIAARGEAAARAADAEIANLEAAGPSPALTHARWRRFASAKVWEIATRALAEASPKDRSRKKQAREASKAVAKWVTPPWVRMRRG